MQGGQEERRRVLWDAGFGACLSVLAILAMTVWFPLDIKGDFVETNFAGRIEPGDAFFPYILAFSVLILGLCTMVSALVRPSSPDVTETSEVEGRLTSANLGFLLRFNAIVILALAVMYWLGPATVWLSNMMFDETATYRQLLDTAPYKFVGYAVGGLGMTLGLIGWARGAVDWRSFAITVVILMFLLLVFDGVLTNVQLPPNADY